jgi:uncharacterized protein YcfL
MYRIPPIALVFVLSAAAMLIGCDATPIPAPGDPYSGGNYPQINLMQDIKGDVVADGPIVTIGPTAPMSVQVPLRNTTHDDLNIQYRFVFFDAAHRELLPDTGWQRLTLPSSAQRMATGSALDMNAADWRLDIQAAR